MGRTGKVLAGRYRVEALLGSGGMGEVYTAVHLLLGERVAIKFLRVNEVVRPDAVARMVQEARATMRFSSEHVVRVYDVAVDDDGCPYLVMEHLNGSDLAETLERSGPFEIERAVDCLLQACKGIGEAHRMGIVHRDLKPANLFLVQPATSGPDWPVVKVLDFGISKDTQLAPQTVDSAGLVAGPLSITSGSCGPLGSPFYMSPEQMELAQDVDSRADVWALGVTLFELITGKRPFTGSSLVEVYTQTIATGRPEWRSALAGVPRELEDILVRCLERDRGQRFATARDLARALRPYGPRREHESGSNIPADRTSRPRNTPTSMTATLRSTALGFANPGKTPSPPPRLGGRGSGRTLLGAGLAAAALVFLAARSPNAGWGRRASSASAAPAERSSGAAPPPLEPHAGTPYVGTDRPMPGDAPSLESGPPQDWVDFGSASITRPAATSSPRPSSETSRGHSTSAADAAPAGARATASAEATRPTPVSSFEIEEMLRPRE